MCGTWDVDMECGRDRIGGLTMPFDTGSVPWHHPHRCSWTLYDCVTALGTNTNMHILPPTSDLESYAVANFDVPQKFCAAV